MIDPHKKVVRRIEDILIRVYYTRWVLFWCTYVTIAFLTFGHVYNRGAHSCDQTRRPDLCELESIVVAAFSGPVWPLYWGLRASIAITK